MDANDAMRRILWRHRWLLLAFTVIPIVLVVPLLSMRPVLYSATANVQAQAAVPDSDTQVLGLVGRVTAVATSLDVVHRAIVAAGVDRSALDVARNHVTAASVGSSGVVAVTVTDRDRAVAVALTRDLAQSVVDSLNSLGSNSSVQLATLTAQQVALTAQRTSLLEQLAKAQAAHQQVTDPGVQALITELNAVEAQLSNNASATQQLLASTGAKAAAGVVNSPIFATAVRAPVASYGALAGLLGLVLGLLIVTVRELVRPTVAEPSAGARELGLVLLGQSRLSKTGAADPDEDLLARLEISAHRIGAGTLVLTGPLPPAQLSALADTLDAGLRPAEGIPPTSGNRAPAIAAVPSSPPAPTQIPRAGRIGGACGPTVTVLSDAALAAHLQDEALILVLPAFAPRSALDQVGDLAIMTGWPVLGVVGVHKQTRRQRKAWKRAAAAAAEAAAAAAEAAAAAAPAPAARAVANGPAVAVAASGPAAAQTAATRPSAVPAAAAATRTAAPTGTGGPAANLAVADANRDAGRDRSEEKNPANRTLVITPTRLGNATAPGNAASVPDVRTQRDVKVDKTGTSS